MTDASYNAFVIVLGSTSLQNTIALVIMEVLEHKVLVKAVLSFVSLKRSDGSILLQNELSQPTNRDAIHLLLTGIVASVRSRIDLCQNVVVVFEIT